MKRMLLTVAAAGALAVPFGVILAEDEPAEPVDPAPASTDPDLVRDRDRRDGDDPPAVEVLFERQAGECDGSGDGPMAHERTGECDGSGEGPMAREQHRVGPVSGEGPMAREREQHRVAEGSGDGPMERQREQHRVDEGVSEVTTRAPAETTAADDGANLQFRYGPAADRGGR